MVFKDVNLCDFCFKQLKENDGEYCTNCGLSHKNYKAADDSLLPGCILSGRYVTGRVWATSGFEKTYLAYSAEREDTVVIRECFPADVVTREHGEEKVSVSDENKKRFESEIRCFYEKKEKIMQLNTTGNMLPEVLDFFYDNGTAYCVIKHIDTVKYTLNEYFVRNKTISEKMSVCMLRDICNALIAIHGAGLMHGNIEPLNIVQTPETTFLASCDFLQTFDNNTGIAYSGFSPIEMYTSKVKKGPYTDIYMLGATFYYAVTGEKLLDAVERMSGKAEVEFDRFLKLTPRFKEILKKCVEVKIEDRYQSAEELLADLSELSRDYYKSLYETISCLYHFDGHSGSGSSGFTSGGCVNLVYSKCNHVLYKESEFYGLNCISRDSVISYYDLPESVRSKEDIIRYAKLKEYYRY